MPRCAMKAMKAAAMKKAPAGKKPVKKAAAPAAAVPKAMKAGIAMITITSRRVARAARRAISIL